jgi:capsid portal protein
MIFLKYYGMIKRLKYYINFNGFSRKININTGTYSYEIRLN